MSDDDIVFLYDIESLWRFHGVLGYVRRYVRRAVNEAARRARREALEDCQSVLDAYNSNVDGFTQSWIDGERAALRRALRPKPTVEEVREQTRERVRRWRERRKTSRPARPLKITIEGRTLGPIAAIAKQIGVDATAETVLAELQKTGLTKFGKHDLTVAFIKRALKEIAAIHEGRAAR